MPHEHDFVPDLSVEIGAIRLQNPIMPASGTFGIELGQVIDLNSLGAFVTKSITAKLREGNPLPRLCETTNGALNSIGIPSKGIDHFLEVIVPAYRGLEPPLIASVSADTIKEFGTSCARLSVDGVAAIEANISCPNLEADGQAFAMSPETAHAAIKEMRRRTELPIWAKLTPNASDVAAVGRAVEEAGADALVVANTILGMAIDAETRRPRLGNIMGGLSGPAIKPIVVRMVYQCARAVRIPIIGCGGIMTVEDAVEYLLAGASAVQIGTATFIRPNAMPDIISGLTEYCRRQRITALRDMVGGVLVEGALVESSR
ncbi:MAG: dihydroorotate dehydrogenase catalytic subunit [Rhodospirillales bacterium]|jgi:dihydroorotate dehydrogenase (NAD+) catalytic subunit|nr:dihydroorotate dehydrogenase catalytic subunit [Rhodospirillales bacterium]